MSYVVRSFAGAADGLFVGHVFEGPEDQLAVNTPEGCVAVEGRIDHLARRLDLATGQVLPWQPPAPADTALQTWRWDEAIERWLPVATLAAIKLEAWRRMKAARDEALQQPLTVTVGPAQAPRSITLDADATAQDALGVALGRAVLARAKGAAARNAWRVSWTLADNSVAVLTADDVEAVDAALDTRTQRLRAYAAGLRAAIAAALDEAGVAAAAIWAPPAG